MILSDQSALDAVARLLERMRETGRMQGRIEVIIDAGQARAVRIVRINECEAIAVSG